MERAAVDGQARAARLQDELDATAEEIEAGTSKAAVASSAGILSLFFGIVTFGIEVQAGEAQRIVNRIVAFASSGGKMQKGRQ